MSSCAERPGTEWLPNESCGFDPSLASAGSALWCRGTSYVVSVSAVKQESLSTGFSNRASLPLWPGNLVSSVCCLWGLFTLFPSSLGVVSLGESSLCVGVSLTAPGFNHLPVSTVQSTQKSDAASSLMPQNKLECCLCCRHLRFQAFVACGTTNEISKLQMKMPGRGRMVEEIIALDLGPVTKRFAGGENIECSMICHLLGWVSISPSIKWVLSIPCSLEQWYLTLSRQWNTWM